MARADDAYPLVPCPVEVAHSTPSPSTLISGIDEVKRLRAQLSRNGFFIVPVETGGKRPLQGGWTDRARRQIPEDLEVVNPKCQNTGILCDGLRVVDVDCDDPAIAARVRSLALEKLGTAPVRTRSNASRSLLVYRAAEGSPSKQKIEGTFGAVEILGHGQQFVAFGMHTSDVPYEWLDSSPLTISRASLTGVTEPQISDFMNACRAVIGASRVPVTFPMSPQGGKQAASTFVGKREPALFSLAGILRSRGVPQEGIIGALHSLNQTFDEPHTAERVLQIAAGIERYSAGVDNPTGEYSDDALALKFTDQHGNNLRYTAAMGRWSVWDGRLWKHDSTCHVFDLSRKVCRSECSTCRNDRLALRIASATTVAAVERLARADRRHAANADQWDGDPWLLNTPAGKVNLRTGKLHPAAREDYMTKITAVAPGAQCPLWLSLLERITDGNPELQGYMQRVCGYALTGVTREHALFFLYGTGANGKSVFLNTISSVMGDYARTAPIEAFVVSTNEHHPTDLAGLQGARLVTAVETEEGRRWAESKIKALTGGDRIAARFMRQDFFEYVPQFKLIVAGNHKPGLRTVDEAMRRRLNLLPFAVTVPVSERDTELAEKLRKEWGGILQWMIQGCLAWQAEGLNAPKAVNEATVNYLAAEDVLSRWIDDCCDVPSSQWTSATALFRSWAQWCTENHEDPGSQKRFSENLGPAGSNQSERRRQGGSSALAW
jgi:putative DNA primase/helicase